MMLLMEYFRQKFGFTSAQWDQFVKNEGKRLENLLDGLPIYTGHTERRDPLHFDSISLKPASEIRVNGGGVESSLEQFIYSKFSVLIKNSNYCCLVSRSGNLGLDSYYPLELVYVDKK